ncbi:MAG: MFS transporter [Gammaproteobacteria bacterium]|nr:MFS transporter [Gammaproteobacteria bacterium]MCH9744548.1 MFS transporter [Gammaproteobacteria bacterium]
MGRRADKTLKELDETKINSYHWRIVLTAGMGFFTDAYDLFIIGVVTAILGPIWHLSGGQLALLKGVSLAAAALGAIFLGSLSDKLGRKKLYGLEVTIMFIGSLVSAFSMNFTWLLIARIVVGFGIGGDYPTSAIVASESANRTRRGFLVLLVFAMQAVGLVVGPMLASLLLATNLPHTLIWRILLGIGAIPAASVFYLRRTIKESPRYLLTKKAPLEVSRMVHDLALKNGHKEESVAFKKQKLLSPKWFKCLIGTAGAWFLMDIAFYGNSISSVSILQAITPNADLLSHTVISAMIFLIFAVPGYFVAAKYVDKIGRKPIQYWGFIMMAVCFGLISIPMITSLVPVFVLIFGISYFFVNFGPNATTFLIPSEVYPTAIRARAHGISAAVGKVGAFIGAFFLPLMLHAYGIHFTMAMMAIVALLGVFVTILIPEMKNVSLDETEEFHSQQDMFKS